MGRHFTLFLAVAVCLSVLITACANKGAAAPRGIAGGARHEAKGAVPGKSAVMTKSEPAGAKEWAEVQAAPADPNAYYASTYEPGYGERERVAKLVSNGVVVEGKEIKLAAFAREYGQGFPMPTDTALGLSAETEQAKIVPDGGTTYLQVGIQAIEMEAPERPPLNIALVIDRSGSMGEQSKLDYAKRAAVELVNRLDRRDRLALITYDSKPSVAVPSTPVKDKARFTSAIEALNPGNLTNIYAALETAYGQMATSLSGDTINTLILLSDGQVTAGTSDRAAFRDLVRTQFDKGIQTTTIGMGLDFAEDLMSLLAREGKGAYHFVQDADSIQTILEREIDDLTHVVAKALRLRIVLDEGVKLLRACGTEALTEEEKARVRADERSIDRSTYEDLGISMDRQEDPNEPGIKMMMPHFYMGDSHVVLLEVEVPEGRGRHKIADVYLKYKDVVFRRNREASAEAWVDSAADKSEQVASTRMSVRKNRCGFETGEALLKAARTIAAGNTAEARRIVDERMAVLGVAAREWNDTDVERDHELLGRYQEVLVSLGQRDLRDNQLGKYLAKSFSYSGYALTR